MDLTSLFPPEPKEDQADYTERFMAIAVAVDYALYAYHREVECLVNFSPDGPWWRKLTAYAEARLSLKELPPDLQAYLRGQLRCAFVPIGEDTACKGDPAPILKIEGDQVDGLEAAVRAHKLGMPQPRFIEEEADIRERANELLHRRLYMGQRCHPSETAMGHLIRNLGIIWRQAVGLTTDPRVSALSAAESTRKRGRGPGRPRDAERAHRLDFVLGVIQGAGLPTPSSRLLRDCLPPLHPKGGPALAPPL